MSPYIVLARVELCWPHPRPRSVRHLLLLARLRPYHYHCLLHATPKGNLPRKPSLSKSSKKIGKPSVGKLSKVEREGGLSHIQVQNCSGSNYMR